MNPPINVEVSPVVIASSSVTVVGEVKNDLKRGIIIAPREPFSPQIVKSFMNDSELLLGLATVIAEAAQRRARRYWIVDNSGSMGTNDGKLFIAGAGGKLVQRQCSRWDELCAAIRWHANTASKLNAPTEFRFMNQPAGAPQVIVVGDSLPQGDAENLRLLETALKEGPRGGTPLCAAVTAVAASLKEIEPALRAVNRAAVLVIASDGAASDGDAAAALKAFGPLPCAITVRLCTNDDSVVNYWNAIDGCLENDVDVLDDLQGDAREVYGQNPWLAYGESLHRAREWGGAPQVLDLLDERPLSAAEAAELVRCLLGDAATAHWPHPADNPKAYLVALRAAMKPVPLIFDTVAGRMRPWIDFKAFETYVLKVSSSVCTIS